MCCLNWYNTLMSIEVSQIFLVKLAQPHILLGYM